MKADDGIEDIRWIRSLGCEKLPAASYALLPNLKKGLFLKLLPSERDREFLSSCFLHSSAQMCLYQTPGRRPPPITGRFVNTVTRGWVGAPNERTPFRFHGAVVGFVDRCLSRTRNLAASNKHLVAFFSGRSWPKIGAGTIFFGVLIFLKHFFLRLVLLSERYRNLLAGIFEIRFFYGNIAFSLSPVLLRFFSEQARLAPPWPFRSSRLSAASVYYFRDRSSFSLLSPLYLYYVCFLFFFVFVSSFLLFRPRLYNT